MIIDALKNTHGNMVKAAQLLHVTDRKFTYKVKKYGVDYRKYR
jgi:Nif-specific regulatory protein